MFALFPISQPLAACPWEINFLYTEQSLTHRPILVRALEMQRVRLWAWEPLWRSRLIRVKNRQARTVGGWGWLFSYSCCLSSEQDAPENFHPHPDCAPPSLL